MNTYLSFLPLRHICLTLLLAVASCGTASAQNTKATFEQLAGKKAVNEIVELWKKTPFETLSTIDSYLEGSLKLVEASDAPDQSVIKSMQTKAMTGARAADEAFGSIIFSEYASSFVGWNREQQQQFRLGQQAYGNAGTAIKAKRFDAALAAGQDCVAKAQPLGDWWGTAMGYSAIGAAHKGLGDTEQALTAFTMSRAIYHDLRLGAAELNCNLELAALLKQTGNTIRLKVTCQQGIALADKLGNNSAKATLSKILASFK